MFILFASHQKLNNMAKKREPLPKVSIMGICNEFKIPYNPTWQSIRLNEPPQITTEKKEQIKTYLEKKNKQFLKLLCIE